MNLLKDPDKRKWVIVATMFIAIICNYLDRQLLSILKPEILEHFGIGDLQYAGIVNVFLICYALMYPVSGILVAALRCFARLLFYRMRYPLP